MASRPARRGSLPSPDDGRRALRWAVIAAVGVVVVGLGVVALVRLTSSSDEAALEVGDWELGRDQLREDLEAVEANAVYRALRDQAGSPLEVRESDGGAFTTSFVAEVLNERLAFRLAEVALDERGAEVNALDRESARDLLAQRLIGSAQLAGGPEATVETVLDGFGSYRPVLEDGLAAIAALRRVVEAEGAAGDAEVPTGEPTDTAPTDTAPTDTGAEAMAPEDAPVSPEEQVAALDRAVREVFIETAQREGVVVAADLGVYDPTTATIGPAGPAVAGLEEVEEDPSGTAIPGDGLSGEGTIGPDGSIDFGPVAPDLGGAPEDEDPSAVGPPSAGDDGSGDDGSIDDGTDPVGDDAPTGP